MTISLWQLVTVIVVMMGSVAGLLRYVFYLLDQHKDHIALRFEEQASHVNSLKQQVKANNDLLHQTREEYAKNARLDAEFTEVMDNFDKVFKYLGGLSRDLNRLIGAHNGKIETKDSNNG